MPRASRFNVVAVAAFVIAGAVAGCGGSNNGPPTGTGGSTLKHPPRSAEVPPPRLPSTDRRAYREIQTASGDLRAAVTPLAYGTAAAIRADRLNADIGRLRRLAPRSALLTRLRADTLTALQGATSAATKSSKATAAAAIAEADRIDSGLRRYAASNPAANEIP